MKNLKITEVISFATRINLVLCDLEMKSIAERHNLELSNTCLKASEYRYQNKAGGFLGAEKILSKLSKVVTLPMDVFANQSKALLAMNRYEIYNRYEFTESGLTGGWLDLTNTYNLQGVAW